jgi:hypothetical protein
MATNPCDVLTKLMTALARKDPKGAHGTAERLCEAGG